MNKWTKWAIVFFVFVNLIFCSWSVLHRDIYYYTDIGRDFLIMDEIAEKKLVLAGPRADFQGLFHGVLWHYLNMPAFLLGRGNPVFMGWFWILLTVGFLAECYFVAKNLFGPKSALIALIFLSAYVVPYTQGFFHGNAAMLVLPAFFYFFVRYMMTGRARYLAGHLLVLGLLVQFEIGVGLPFIILSTFAALYLIFRRRKFSHLACFGIFILTIFSFLLFDLRHNFLQVRSALAYFSGTRNEAIATPFVVSLKDRLTNFTSTVLNFFKFSLSKFNIYIFIFFVYGFFQILKKQDKYKKIYIAFLYFYVGYYILSLFHGGLLIVFWWLPLSVLPILIFSSLHRYTPKWIYYGLLAIVLIVTFVQNISFLQNISAEFGKTTTSWQFHLATAKTLLADAPSEFGYFIYAPDIYGYQDKYAFSYAPRLFNKKAYRFEKRPITYVAVEPPPGNRPDLSPDWWIKGKLGIGNSPVKKIKLQKGYEIRKYELSPEDIKIPSQITTSDWLFFR